MWRRVTGNDWKAHMLQTDTPQQFTTFEQIHRESATGEGFLKGRRASTLLPHIQRYCVKQYRKTGQRLQFTLEQRADGLIVRYK